MIKYKNISTIDLSQYEKPVIPGNKNAVTRSVWYFINVLLFSNQLALLPSKAKAEILKIFGARIGKYVVIKPSVSIKYPWFLNVGESVWLGEGVWIDNHTTVSIGKNCCISQGVYIYTGNHDWNDEKFAFFCNPVRIGDGVWITAFQKIGPGGDVPSNVAVISAQCCNEKNKEIK